MFFNCVPSDISVLLLWLLTHKIVEIAVARLLFRNTAALTFPRIIEKELTWSIVVATTLNVVASSYAFVDWQSSPLVDISCEAVRSAALGASVSGCLGLVLLVYVSLLTHLIGLIVLS